MPLGDGPLKGSKLPETHEAAPEVVTPNLKERVEPRRWNRGGGTAAVERRSHFAVPLTPTSRRLWPCRQDLSCSSLSQDNDPNASSGLKSSCWSPSSRTPRPVPTTWSLEAPHSSESLVIPDRCWCVGGLLEHVGERLRRAGLSGCPQRPEAILRTADHPLRCRYQRWPSGSRNSPPRCRQPSRTPSMAWPQDCGTCASSPSTIPGSQMPIGIGWCEGVRLDPCRNPLHVHGVAA